MSLKDRREKFHIEIFSTLHQLPCEELLRQDAGQKPDFLYRTGKLVVGVEHTELKKTKAVPGKSSLAELKGIHRQVVRRAEQLAAEQGILPINVQVWFNDYFDRYPNRGEKTVQALLNIITENLDKILETEYGNSIEIAVPEPFVASRRFMQDQARFVASFG